MRRWYTLIVIMTVAGMLLTACSSKSPAVDPKDQAGETSEEGQTLTVINPDSVGSKTAANSPANETQKYEIQTRLTDFQLLGDSTGLAWGTTRSELRLYMTNDSGETWTNISPATSVLFSSNPQYGKDIYFVSPTHGWIIRNFSESGEAIVLRTIDGGATWKMTSLPKANEVASVFFINEDRGWILSIDNSQKNDTTKTLYLTNNGGASWIKVMSSPLFPTGPEATNATPIQSNSVSMTFSNEKLGYISAIEFGHPEFYVTRNGGVSWNKSDQFFDMSKYKNCSSFLTGTPTFFNNSDIGWIPVGCSRDDAVKYNGYFTNDGGKTWAYAPFDIDWITETNKGAAPFFINSLEGWNIRNGAVYHTTDQGKTWTALPVNGKLHDVMTNLAYNQVVKLQFYTAKFGWLLVAKSDGKRSLLMQTTDGGRSWRVL
ncbi:WD40/YVTN/BNR-like repeat-containing protein [Paenibacillus lutimineralis]|uniref:WD40/YVTN/BNR-like repeat-containing protein n=1 Tax=Paenibacillus lutimineralis TaxID=2707005 RepID=UPI001D042F87|nr:YCF48-related protein [Paenibacillus lutimineralis]